MYCVTMKNCNIEINKIKLHISEKKFLKQKFPREISRHFQVTAQAKQVKDDVKLHDILKTFIAPCLIYSSPTKSLITSLW